jgi:hypothetical protein
MTGAYHFGMTEGLLEEAINRPGLSEASQKMTIALAGVHATLALVAAHLDTRGNCHIANDEQWEKVRK